MNSTVIELPNDVESLKEIAVNQFSEIQYLKEQLGLIRAQKYAAKSEAHLLQSLQVSLFPDLDPSEETGLEPDSAAKGSEPNPKSRKRGKRRKLPASLPPLEAHHQIDPQDLKCACGAEMVEIGEEVSEQLDVVPAKIFVVRHHRHKYACRACEEEVKTATLPPQPLPKSNASPGLLAYIIISKFVDGLPLHRIEKQFLRQNIVIPRQSMARWLIELQSLLMPLIGLFNKELLRSNLILMDETTIQVTKPSKVHKKKNCYMWVRACGPPNRAIVLFDYQPSRSGQVPLELLASYDGALMTDGYAGYGAIGSKDSIVHLQCFAHARRKFTDALKAMPQSNSEHEPSRAEIAIAYIKDLYRIEKEAKELGADERYRYRQQHSVPILKTIRQWLDDNIDKVPPSLLTGKALQYLNNHWDKLIRYCDNGEYPIDNNRAENAIRPFVVGRKNWLFADTEKGAQANAVLYSLVETAKANGLNPYDYMRKVLTFLPIAKTATSVEALLPWNIESMAKAEKTN